MGVNATAARTRRRGRGTPPAARRGPASGRASRSRGSPAVPGRRRGRNWLGDMTPRETGRLLEAIERGTLTSAASAASMKAIMSRQQAGARRIRHYLDVPVAHKTGDSAVIANDVGLVSARSGTVVLALFVNGVTGPYAETEDRIGRVARQIVDYFDGASR
ncbi:MAG: serine hydrolase [Acidobacteriota bacterium]